MVGLVKNGHQDITYWERASGVDDYNQQGFSVPVLFTGRWQQVTQEVTTPGGDTIVSKAVAYVPQAVAIGGYLALGNYLTEANPQVLEAGWQIQAYQESPDLRTMSQQRRAYL